MIVYYLPLEPYRERYTELLTKWTTDRFDARGVPVTALHGASLGHEGIRTGAVLDAHGRSYWSLTQMALLVEHLPRLTRDDVIYLDDMFTPGYEALLYILDQVPRERRPRVYARNHAQSVDPDDFTFPMRGWMRRYEEMVYRTATGIICASTVHREMMEAACLEGSVHVLGLPYDADDVLARASGVSPWAARPLRVVYSSRLDREKQPHFMMDIAERVKAWDAAVDFVVCTGSSEPRSNDPTALARLLDLEAKGVLRVARGLTKAAYYGILRDARVQLNTARQDFVSYTAIEASTLGVPTAAPGFRSFPEALANDPSMLYTPWVVDDAVARVVNLLAWQMPSERVRRLSDQQHGTLDRIIDLFQEEAP